MSTLTEHHEQTHCAHVYFYFLTNQPDTKAFRAKRLAPLSTCPIGSVYIWERKYADLQPRTSFVQLTNNPNWKMKKSWPAKDSDKQLVVIFEKISDLPYDEDLTPKGKNLSY